MCFNRDTCIAGCSLSFSLSLSFSFLNECMSREERKEKTKQKRRIKLIDEIKMTESILVLKIYRNDP